MFDLKAAAAAELTAPAFLLALPRDLGRREEHEEKNMKKRT